VVCEAALASFAEKIGLGEFLMLGRGEAQNGGAEKPAILADAFEALLAAIYLDAGAEEGMQSVASFLLPMVKSAIDALPEVGDVRIDSKSRLQEFIQQDREQKEVLEYRLTGESGPDHNKTFTVDLYLGANCIGSGKGHSKKAAEQAAAKAALSLFGLI
jgi:ribonuclease-3